MSVFTIWKYHFLAILTRLTLMQKGEGIGKVTFLCVIVADVFIFAPLVGYFMEIRKQSGLRDPTCAEALQFIMSDDTDQNKYNQTYTCENFATDFRNNAFKAGYRCGYVLIEFPDAWHAIICFDTSDKGPVFIEPQNDQIVPLAIGKTYLNRLVIDFSITWAGS